MSRSGPAEQRLEVDVPDPRDVLPVGDRVVERDDSDGGRAALEQRPHGLVRAGGVLDQEDQQLLVADRDPLEAAERGAEPLQPGADLLERRAERVRERGRAERVVDVVEARAGRAARATLPSGVTSVKRRRLEPVSSISRAATSSAGRAWPQRGQR